MATHTFRFPAGMDAAIRDVLGEAANGLSNKEAEKLYLESPAQDMYVRYKRRVDGPAARASFDSIIAGAQSDIDQATLDSKAADRAVWDQAIADFVGA